ESSGRGKSEVEEDEAIRRELLRLFPSHWREYLSFNIPSNFRHFWWDVKRYQEEKSVRYLLGRKIPYIVLLAVALPALFKLLWRLVRHSRVTLYGSVPEVSTLILIITCTMISTIFEAYM